jgi:hypothetical protein
MEFFSYKNKHIENRYISVREAHHFENIKQSTDNHNIKKHIQIKILVLLLYSRQDTIKLNKRLVACSWPTT